MAVEEDELSGDDLQRWPGDFGSAFFVAKLEDGYVRFEPLNLSR